jgi:hypothetical protein
MLHITITLVLLLTALSCFSQSKEEDRHPGIDQIRHLKDFDVIEFRRYTTKQGERNHFALYFENYFPEAFEQLGAIVFGQFLERENHSGFTWLRGFKSMEAQAIVNSAFYYGSLWKEHGKTMNVRVNDTDNVMLLRPIRPGRGIMVLPAVDPVMETDGAQGVVVAQIFAVQAEKVDSFGAKAEEVFARYRVAGVREAGLLVTLDAPNNFPQLPVRTDGPYLVWIGIIKNNLVLDTVFRPLVERHLPSLASTDLLRSTPELIILDPTKRSRLRWLND